MITGTPAVTFTRDEGRTLAPTAESLTGIGYTYGLTPLDTPGTLLAWHKSQLLLSADDGCSWRAATSVNADVLPILRPAKGGRAYAWADNRLFLMRYDSGTLVQLKPPVDFIGLAVDAEDAAHVRAGGGDGSLWDSRDAGETWVRLGSIQSSVPLFYRVAFNPEDLDHMVAGTAGDGAQFSTDGGRTWRRATGMGSGSVNAFNFVISPADGNVVWAMALNLRESDDPNAPSHGRHIYRSTDGGATYVPVVDESPSVALVNGPVMAAHPSDPNVLYFVFGTYVQGYGTDLFRFDAASRTLSVTHNDNHDINAIAFSPRDAKVMYLGLETERGVQ